MEPRFIKKAEFKVVGIECIGSNQNGEFAQLWEKFAGRVEEITSCSQEGIFYGLCGCGPECDPDKGICKCAETGFSYTACIEVPDANGIPAGMVTKTIPAANYAVFTHKGSLEKLSDTYNFIYQTWLRSPENQQSAHYCFELYDERFDPAGEDSELDIYVPVK